jgi:rhodanese-related sulfurtransferase
VLGRLILPSALDPAAFEAAVAAGTTIVDARGRESFAAGHIRGAINIELDSAFAGYVGWLVPFAAPVLLVLPEGTTDAVAEATTELLRIGYEWVPGFLDGGVDAWAASGRPLASYDTTDMAALHGARATGEDRSVLLDVRQPIEWQTEGVVPGSENVFVADLPSRLGELPAGRPITVYCRSGHRASMAASLLDGAGFDVRLVSQGGAADWPEPLAALSGTVAGTARS